MKYFTRIKKSYLLLFWLVKFSNLQFRSSSMIPILRLVQRRARCKMHLANITYLYRNIAGAMKRAEPSVCTNQQQHPSRCSASDATVQWCMFSMNSRERYYWTWLFRHCTTCWNFFCVRRTSRLFCLQMYADPVVLRCRYNMPLFYHWSNEPAFFFFSSIRAHLIS